MTARLVLASASAARARLLDAAGIAFTRDPAALDEAAIKKEFRRGKGDAGDCAAALAAAKARLVAARHRGALVIGADQLLACAGEWFDKPRDMAAARAQLRALRDRQHELATAVAVWRDGVALWHFVARPCLTLRGFSEDFLDAYLAEMGPAVLESVGAYQLEGRGAQLIARIEGDYFAVLGLPLLPLLEFLRGEGVIAT
jgi:septum formation protein